MPFTVQHSPHPANLCGTGHFKTFKECEAVNLKKRHQHDFNELCRYYHVYDNGDYDYNEIAGIPTVFGIHVEINSLMVCPVCGKKEIENHSNKLIGKGIDSLEYSDYIKELAAQNIISESDMEAKYSNLLDHIKMMKQWDE